VHTLLAQSAAAPHFLPSVHVAHPDPGPPQSLSDSVPLSTASLHVALWQTALVQTPLVQSEASAQTFVGAQAPHPTPPQSVSVSVPFFTPSAQPDA